MGMFKNLKRLHKPVKEDLSSLKELSKATKTNIKLMSIIQGCALFILIAALIWFIASISQCSSLEKSIRAEYGPEFTDQKVYIAVDIKTALIESYEGGLAKTNLGVVIVDKKPKQTIMLVFEDLEGKMQPVEFIDQSNALTADMYEYVGKDFENPSDTTLVDGTVQVERIKYKGYVEVATELSRLKAVKTTKGIVFAIILVVNLIIGALLTSFIRGYKKVNFGEYKADDTLKSDGTKAKKHKKIEKKGIGSDSNTPSEGYNRTADDAIAAEGGFTGNQNSSQQTTESTVVTPQTENQSKENTNADNATPSVNLLKK